tara:strand:- start:414 stop:605 length:192 start_codon:yes stop_codon:yes gene_type:complete
MDYGKKYLPNDNAATQEKFNKLVNEMNINMSLESAISLALAEMRENKKSGGLISKPLGPGGKK